LRYLCPPQRFLALQIVFLTLLSLAAGQAQISSHHVDLSWEPSPSSPVGYLVYRGSSSGGPYMLLNTALIQGTTFTDNDVPQSSVFFYVVTAVDSNLLESVFSNEVRVVVPGPPFVVSVDPDEGNGVDQTFSFQFQDVGGASNISGVQTLITPSLDLVSSCRARYDPVKNEVFLIDDTGDVWLGPQTLGASGSLQNSSCSIDMEQSSATASDTVLTLNLATSFQSTFKAATTIFGLAENNSGTSGWIELGAWIAKPSLIITADDAARAYGDSNPAFTGMVGATQNGDVITASYTTSANSASPVGTYPIVPIPSGDALSNYDVALINGTLTVYPAPLTITAKNVSRAYGAAGPVLIGTIAGIQNADAITASYATSATAASPVGIYPILPTPAGTALSNYSMSLINGVLTVTPAALTITVNNASRTYGSTNPTFSGVVGPTLNGDVITATYTTVATSSSPVGIYPIVPTPSSTLGNYEVTLVNGTLTVARASSATTITSGFNPAGLGQSVIFTATVGSAAGAPTGTVTFKDASATLGSATVNGDGTTTFSTSALVVGTHFITAEYGGDQNFTGSISSPLTQTVSSTPPDFSIMANPTSASIHAGQSTTFTLSVNPVGGFNSPVTFSCSGVPSSAACTFTPGTVTPNGAPVTSNLTVTTTGPSASMRIPGSRMQPATSVFAWWMSAGTMAIAGMVLVAGMRRESRRHSRWMIVFLLCLATLAVPGCGGGGSTSQPTPQASSTITQVNATITVIATAGGTSSMTHNATLTVSIGP
jgi:hypothetical protein